MQNWTLKILPKRCCLSVAVLFVTLASGLRVFGDSELNEYVILANKDAPIESIGKGDLARLYLSKIRQIDGSAYRVVNLAEDRVKQAFLGDLTSMSEMEIEKHYIAMELRGNGEKPKEVKSSKSMIFLLVKSEKIIGWLPVSEYEKLSPVIKDQMRVIRLR